MRFRRLAALGFALSVLLATNPARAGEREIGGKAAGDVFPETATAVLAEAACLGDQAAVRRSIEAGSDPNSMGLEGVTPLLWAAHCENLEGMTALLDGGADPNQLIGGRFSAVFVAATMENSAVLRLLLAHGGNPNSLDHKTGRTALWEALVRGVDGRWQNYYALLDARADINRADEVDRTIADSVVAFGLFDKAIELIERGYTHDLPGLGRAVGNRVPTEAQAEYRSRLIGMLKERGVRFPAMPVASP